MLQGTITEFEWLAEMRGDTQRKGFWVKTDLYQYPP